MKKYTLPDAVCRSEGHNIGDALGVYLARRSLPVRRALEKLSKTYVLLMTGFDK